MKRKLKESGIKMVIMENISISHTVNGKEIGLKENVGHGKFLF